jgi:hypothetical protein
VVPAARRPAPGSNHDSYRRLRWDDNRLPLDKLTVEAEVSRIRRSKSAAVWALVWIFLSV